MFREGTVFCKKKSDFLKIWTLKEALYKAGGSIDMFSPCECDVSSFLENNKLVKKSNMYYSKTVKINDYLLSIVKTPTPFECDLEIVEI